MSRAYRITVQESVRRVVHAEDHVRTQLEMLEVLPCDQMAELLAAELAKIGFVRDGDVMLRDDDRIHVEIDLNSGEVTVSIAREQEVEVSKKKSGSSYEPTGENAKKLKQKLRSQLDAEINKDVQQRQDELQNELTNRLEAELSDIRQELDQASNRATAAALKQKAAQLGQIKELTEDPQSGSLTIVVEL